MASSDLSGKTSPEPPRHDRVFGAHLTLQKLEVFCLVAELRSVTRAAERIGIAQPAVTAHLRGLESKLRMRLVTRSGRNIELTIRGAFFFHLWGLPGALAGAALVSWRGLRFGLLILLSGGIAVSGVLGFIVSSGPKEPLSIMVALSIAGASVAGLQAGLYSLSAGLSETLPVDWRGFRFWYWAARPNCQRPRRCVRSRSAGRPCHILCLHRSNAARCCVWPF